MCDLDLDSDYDIWATDSFEELIEMVGTEESKTISEWDFRKVFGIDWKSVRAQYTDPHGLPYTLHTKFKIPPISISASLNKIFHLLKSTNLKNGPQWA